MYQVTATNAGGRTTQDLSLTIEDVTAPPTAPDYGRTHFDHVRAEQRVRRRRARAERQGLLRAPGSSQVLVIDTKSVGTWKSDV